MDGISSQRGGNLPVEHSVEGCDLVNTHWGHFKKLRNVVHNADTCPTFVLSLTEVKEGYHRRLLVLGRVMRDYLLCPFQVLLIEFKWYLRYTRCNAFMSGNASMGLPWDYCKEYRDATNDMTR